MTQVAPHESSKTSAEPPEIRWPRRVLFRLIQSILVVLASLLLVEVAARLSFEQEDVAMNYWGRGAFIPAASVGFRHAPGYSGRAYRSGVFEVPVRISAEGLRQHNVRAQRAFSRRLLILGDSYAFGLGVCEQEGFAARLQAPLNARGLGVINGAQTGYCVEQERRLGQQLIAAYRPHIVLLAVFVGNDIEGDYVADYATVEVSSGFRLLGDRWLPIAPVDYPRTHSYLGLWSYGLQARKRNLRIHQRFLDRARRDPGAVVRPTLTALTKLARECDTRRVRLAVLVIPPRRQELPIGELLLQALDAAGLPFLDLGQAGLGPEDYFVGDNHWNARGHAKVAELLVPFVETVDAATTSSASGPG
jgi:hypothetical protein